MDTYQLPDQHRHPLPEEIAAHIERYRPSRMPESQWREIEDTVKTLAAATEPVSIADANVTCGSAAKFLAWVCPRAGTVDPAQVFTHHWVDRFALENPTGVGAGTQQSQVPRLRRLVRVLAGEASRTPRSPRDSGPAPYAPGELQRLTEASRTCPALRGVLAQMDAGTLSGTNAPDGWTQALKSATAHGVVLNLRRLRATTVALVLAQPASTAQLIGAHNLTRADLNNVMDHLSLPASDVRRTMLRG